MFIHNFVRTSEPLHHSLYNSVRKDMRVEWQKHHIEENMQQIIADFFPEFFTFLATRRCNLSKTLSLLPSHVPLLHSSAVQVFHPKIDAPMRCQLLTPPWWDHLIQQTKHRTSQWWASDDPINHVQNVIRLLYCYDSMTHDWSPTWNNNWANVLDIKKTNPADGRPGTETLRKGWCKTIPTCSLLGIIPGHVMSRYRQEIHKIHPQIRISSLDFFGIFLLFGL